MDDLKEINRLIHHSQCYITQWEDWRYLLYDEYNEYDVTSYKSLNTQTILTDIKKHLDLKIQDNLTDNTITKLKKFMIDKYNVSLNISDLEIELILNSWNIKKISLKDFKSMNIKVMKLTLVDKFSEELV